MSAAKQLSPPFKMRVERGRLVPATQYDQERLDSYRNGSIINVRITADRMRPLERKYRAIVGKIVKECQTPWTNAEAAHQALKVACGYVSVGRTIGGAFMQSPRSIAEFDDAEMEDYFERSLQILERLTGVPAETMKRETKHVDAEDDEIIDPQTGEITNITNTGPEPSSPEAGDDGDGYATTPSSSEPDPAIPPPDPGSNDGSAETNASQRQAEPSSSDYHLWLLNVARMLWATAIPAGDRDVLSAQRESALIAFPKPADLPKQIDDKAKAVYRRCMEVIDTSIEQQDALALIAGIVGADQDDILRKAGS
jgi:hypothetical protein